MVGLYRGVVVKTIYPDDPQNSNKVRVEYTVRVNGQDYSSAVNARESGGIYNYKERIRKHSEIVTEGTEVGRGSLPEMLDGEYVYVMFLEGNGNIPVIVGGAPHPQQSKYKKHKKSEGIFEETEFNGVRVSIDKDSNWTVQQVGRKDPKDKTFKKLQNEKAKGAQIRLGGIDGDVTIKGAKGFFNIDKDGSVKLIAQDGSIISMDATSGAIIIASKDGNVITMDKNAVVIAEKTGKSVISLKGDTAQVTSKKVLVQSEETSINSGTVNLGTAAVFSGVIYENLKTIFDAHIHATAVGPSGPPLPPNTLALMELSPATSAQAKFVKVRGNI